MGFLDDFVADILGAERITPRVVDPNSCGCCAGETSGIGYLCPGCQTAMETRDRSAHPHPPSAAQRALVAREGNHGGGVDDTMAYGVRNADGTVTVIAVGPVIVDQAGTSAREIPGDSPSP